MLDVPLGYDRPTLRFDADRGRVFYGAGNQAAILSLEHLELAPKDLLLIELPPQACRARRARRSNCPSN